MNYLTEDELDKVMDIDGLTHLINTTVDPVNFQFNDSQNLIIVKIVQQCQTDQINEILERIEYFFNLHGYYFDDLIIVDNGSYLNNGNHKHSVFSLNDMRAMHEDD